MLDKLKNLPNYTSHCKFFSNDGYYYPPYFADSPQKMIQGFKSLPFTKRDDSRNLIIANNHWLEIKVQYMELESELWLMINDEKFKSNICTCSIYEEPKPSYYSLYYYANKTTLTEFYEPFGQFR